MRFSDTLKEQRFEQVKTVPEGMKMAHWPRYFEYPVNFKLTTICTGKQKSKSLIMFCLRIWEILFKSPNFLIMENFTTIILFCWFEPFLHRFNFFSEKKFSFKLPTWNFFLNLTQNCKKSASYKNHMKIDDLLSLKLDVGKHTPTRPQAG